MTKTMYEKIKELGMKKAKEICTGKEDCVVCRKQFFTKSGKESGLLCIFVFKNGECDFKWWDARKERFAEKYGDYHEGEVLFCDAKRRDFRWDLAEKGKIENIEEFFKRKKISFKSITEEKWEEF